MHSLIDERDEWLRTIPLRLRDDVEIITGAGGRSMLVSGRGKFLAISPSGVSVVRRMDGATGLHLIQTLSIEHPEQAATIKSVIPVFLADLRQASILTIDPEPVSRTASDRFVRLGKLDPVKRFPLVQNPNRYVRPVATVLARIPGGLLCGALLLLPLVVGPLILLALREAGTITPTVPIFVLAAAVMICEIFLHESAHAVAMAYNDVRAKNAGVGLLFWFIPLAYVDRTESYRHRGRLGRALISLAGPLLDVALAGVSAIVVLTCTGEVATFFHVLLVLQILSLLANLNPLFPSDGYHALEAGFGAINMRSRALTYVLHRVSRRSLPSYLTGASRRARTGYVLYVVLSVGYTLLIAVMVLLSMITLAVRLAS